MHISGTAWAVVWRRQLVLNFILLPVLPWKKPLSFRTSGIWRISLSNDLALSRPILNFSLVRWRRAPCQNTTSPLWVPKNTSPEMMPLVMIASISRWSNLKRDLAAEACTVASQWTSSDFESSSSKDEKNAFTKCSSPWSLGKVNKITFFEGEIEDDGKMINSIWKILCKEPPVSPPQGSGSISATIDFPIKQGDEDYGICNGSGKWSNTLTAKGASMGPTAVTSCDSNMHNTE